MCQAENIVPVGSISPNAIHLPGVYVDRIVKATAEKQIDILTLAQPEPDSREAGKHTELDIRHRIARRAAKELKDGFHVNLGIGMPTLVPEHLPPGVKVWLQSENGILGMGPYPTKEQLDACEHFPEKYSAYVELVYLGTSSTQEKRPLPCYLERQCSVCGDAGLVSAGLLMSILADTSESFAMIRGGHIDVAILGVSSQPCKSGIHTY